MNVVITADEGRHSCCAQGGDKHAELLQHIVLHCLYKLSIKLTTQLSLCPHSLPPLNQLQILNHNVSLPPANYCIYHCNPALPSAYYKIVTPQGVERVYCEMDTTNCGNIIEACTRAPPQCKSCPCATCIRLLHPAPIDLCPRWS